MCRRWPSSQSKTAEWQATRFCESQRHVSNIKSLWSTYIPDDDGIRSPADTSLGVLRQGDVVEQELEEVVGFLFLVSYNVAGD